MKVFVECQKSKEKGTLYHVLKCDFGYRQGILTMDKDVICEMGNILYSQLYAMKENEKIQIGEFLQKPVGK